MQMNPPTASFFSSRRAWRIGAAVAAALLAEAAICPALSQVNHNSNNVQLNPAPPTQPRATAPCPPADQKKAAALKDKIEREKDRLEGLKQKIADRTQQMEKIQPGSSTVRYYARDFAEGSRLYNLALANRVNTDTIDDLTHQINVDTRNLAAIGCQ